MMRTLKYLKKYIFMFDLKDKIQKDVIKDKLTSLVEAFALAQLYESDLNTDVAS